MKHGTCPRCKRKRTLNDWEPATRICGRCQYKEDISSDGVPVEDRNERYIQFTEFRRGLLRDPVDNLCSRC